MLVPIAVAIKTTAIATAIAIGIGTLLAARRAAALRLRLSKIQRPHCIVELIDELLLARQLLDAKSRVVAAI